MTHDHQELAAWDPARYLTFAGERARPFVDLLARVPASEPDLVVDLGCGPGNLTRLLARRWPGAQVLGLDSSREMVDRARADAADDPSAVRFERADLRDWVTTGEAADVVISNATLQWVPGHLDLLPGLVGRVRSGGWLAFAVPGNFTEPSHRLLQELAADPRYAGHTAALDRPAAHDATTYWQALARLGCRVDAWETTYLHVLTGEDPVFTWLGATAARPVLASLPETLRSEFAAHYRAALRAAYLATPYGVPFPFRRTFVAAQVPA